MHPRLGTLRLLSALLAPLFSCAACGATRNPVVGSNPPVGAPSARIAASSGPDGRLPLVTTDADVTCKAPTAILSKPSPFHAALVRWSEEPAGSPGANAALEAACDAATEGSRATERAACVLLGLAYASGDGVKRDPLAAFAYFERGATCELSFGAFDFAQAREHAIPSDRAYRRPLARNAGCCA